MSAPRRYGLAPLTGVLRIDSLQHQGKLKVYLLGSVSYIIEGTWLGRLSCVQRKAENIALGIAIFTRLVKEIEMPRLRSNSKTSVRPARARWISALLFVLFAVLSSVSAQAAKVGARYERDADFSGLSTYAWRLHTERPAEAALAVGGELDTLIRGIITEELERRGFRLAGEETPDFEISYDAFVETMVDHPALRKEIVPGVAWVIEGDYRSWEEGSLYIWLYRYGGKHPLWTSWATKNLAEPKEAPDPQKLRRTVRKMLRRLPSH